MCSAKPPMWALEDSCRFLGVVLAALALLTACGGVGAVRDATSDESGAGRRHHHDGRRRSHPPRRARRTQKWIELQVGDCLADPPPSDPSVVTVSVVDCAIAHAAEVYLRADVEVNAAIADVADRQCDAGFTQYTGQPAGSGPFVVTYLIDSNQDRTSANPLPSTVICLLQAPTGGPLTGSARR